MIYDRKLNLKSILKNKSLLLFGPRQTGKSTLIKENFSISKEKIFLDLLDNELFRDLSTYPERLRGYIDEKTNIIVIDEIQKIPALLNEVHRLIEERKNLRFILTGSSARSLKKIGTNLLAGRAWIYNIHPLTTDEVGDFNQKTILKFLNNGGIPPIFTSPFPKKELKSYVATYLKEEIRAEAVVRNFEAFSRFLETSAFSNGEILNFTSIGNDVGIPPRTIIEYFRILEDTLVGYLLPPKQFKKMNRKEVATSKFFFFDVGIANHLLKRGNIEEGGELFGRTLEHFVFQELKAALDYFEVEIDLNFWAVHGKTEVDFVVGDDLAIEVKASKNITQKHLEGLRFIAEENKKIRKVIISTESRYRKTEDGIEIYPYVEFFKKLWSREFF